MSILLIRLSLAELISTGFVLWGIRAITKHRNSGVAVVFPGSDCE